VRNAPTLDDFFADDGSRFIRIGELQRAAEDLQKLRARGMDSESIRRIEELVPRMENTFALLLRMIEEKMGPPRV